MLPLRRGVDGTGLDDERLESKDVDDRDCPSRFFRLLRERGNVPPVPNGSSLDTRAVSRFMEGRTNFFCFEAGRISSRSTGTPRETRKRRRIRDLVQFGGWSGGGATS